MEWNVYRQYQYGLSRRYDEFRHAKSVWESKTENINMGILTSDISIEMKQTTSIWQAISARKFKIRLRNYTIDISLGIQTGKLSIQI